MLLSREVSKENYLIALSELGIYRDSILKLTRLHLLKTFGKDMASSDSMSHSMRVKLFNCLTNSNVCREYFKRYNVSVILIVI